MSVLLVEDDPEIAAFVSKELVRASYEVKQVNDGAKALKLAMSSKFAALILDLMLPEMDGLSLIRALRAANVQTPILVLSAKRSTQDKVLCLREGADDYVAKPFDAPELLARLEAVLRRSQPTGESERIESAGVVLDLLNRTVRRDGDKLELTPREFALLELLMRNVNRPLSKSYLIERLWDYRFLPQTNLVDVLVCRLRNNIDRNYPAKLIQTVRGIGYVFRAP